MVHYTTRSRLLRAVPILLQWHRKNQRSFIWRELRRSPYVVLVSEFMLQQTGVKQVEKKLPEFLQQFPSVKELASAPRAEVLRAWQGLGYNRRALNLHQAAKAIAKLRVFPKTLEELRSLPGVGLYTASAVLAFAYNEDVPVVDVNIERVLSRWWKLMKHPNEKLPMRDIYELDAAILPKAKSSAWHEALMDLGSTICTKNAPKCRVCPVQGYCKSAGKLSLAVSENIASSEKRHFGQPRRIWRGRILHLISKSESITKRNLLSELRKIYEIADPAFVPFVTSILSSLTEEGFITQTEEGAITLAKD
jgi:A/G-specific adenine glycosylase